MTCRPAKRMAVAGWRCSSAHNADCALTAGVAGSPAHIGFVRKCVQPTPKASCGPPGDAVGDGGAVGPGVPVPDGIGKGEAACPGPPIGATAAGAANPGIEPAPPDEPPPEHAAKRGTQAHSNATVSGKRIETTSKE